MKQTLKKFTGVLLVMLCTGILCACGSRGNTSGLTDEEAEGWKTQTVNFVSELTQMSDENLESLLQYGDFYEAAVKEWKENRENLGAYQTTEETKCTLNGDILTVTADMQFEKKAATVILTIDQAENTPTYLTIEVQRTMGEKMKEAGSNTLLGILVVFVVLIFLSFLIYLFKYINLWVVKQEQKKCGHPLPASETEGEPDAGEQREDLTDDEELVAVIAAAIAAAEQTSTDGFVVRSIKKVHGNNWKRA